MELNINNITSVIDKVNPLKNNSYKERGVIISPKKVKANNNIHIKYSGVLSENTDNIYMHYGESIGNEWKHSNDIKMIKEKEGQYEAEISVPTGSHINIAFHDESNNWDNNNGENYSYVIENKF